MKTMMHTKWIESRLMQTRSIGHELGRAALALSALAIGQPTYADPPHRWQLNMTEGVTQTSQSAYDLHMLAFLICCAIGAIVFGMMFIAMWKFRKSKGAVAGKWSHNTAAEVILTVVPTLILIGMAWPATKVMLASADTSESELTIKVTGYQWKWRYEYVGTDINYMSSLKRSSDEARHVGSGIDPYTIENYLLDVDRPLVIPADTKVRFVITAEDVIHAWWVPALGWKQDAIPGIINDSWTRVSKPGIYRGQCAELCGKDHGFMPIVVEVKPKAEFDQWLVAQQSGSAIDTANIAAAAPAAVAPAMTAPAQTVPAATVPAATVPAATVPAATAAVASNLN
jgi:cytochrome c oxidase subunit II